MRLKLKVKSYQFRNFTKQKIYHIFVNNITHLKRDSKLTEIYYGKRLKKTERIQQKLGSNCSLQNKKTIREYSDRLRIR